MATLAWRSSESAFRWTGTEVPAKDERNMMEFLGIAGIPGGINILALALICSTLLKVKGGYAIDSNDRGIKLTIY